jgi:uncharacterized spore protein YtfJ
MKKILIVLIVGVLLSGFVFSQNAQDMTIGMLSEALSTLKADVAIGSPVTVGNMTLIPLFKATTGFGGGGGGPDGVVYGSGVGGSLEFLPYAIVIISESEVKVVPVLNQKPFFEQLVDALPKILPMVTQVMSMFGAAPAGK